MIDESVFVSRFKEILRSELDRDDVPIAINTVQEDVKEWDSLAHVRIVMGVERAFDIQLDISEIEDIKSVRGFYDAVNRHLQ